MTPILLLLLAVSSQAPSARIDFLLQHAADLQSARQRRADLAIPFLLEAVESTERLQDTTREAKALVQLGRAYSSTHQQEKSFEAFRRALQLSRVAGEADTETNALAGLGGLHSDRGEFDEAQKCYRVVLDIGTRDSDAGTRVRGLNGLAAIADHRGRSKEGATWARIALAELDAGTREGKSFMTQAYFSVPYNLAKALSEEGEYAQASIYFERARVAAERDGAIAGVWHVLHETGEMYRSQGDLSTAVRYYQRALAEANRLESHDPEAITLRALGAAAEARGDFGAALVHYQEAMAIFDKAGFGSELPQTLTMLSRVQFMTGKRDAARASLDRAAALSATMGQSIGEFYTKFEAGRQKFESGDLRAAESEFLSALDVARTNKLDSFSASALLGLADIARAEGKIESALQRYSDAADAIDATRAKIPSIEARSMYVSATHEIYEHWLDTLFKAGLHDRAFIVIERERSRNLLDALLSQAIERPPEVRALNTRISTLQVQLTSSALVPAKRRFLLDQLDDAERKLDLMQTSTKAPPRFNRDLPSLRRTLQEDEAWIEYSTRPNAVIVFLLTRHGFSAMEHATSSLESRIDFFNDLLNSAHSEEAIRPGVALSNDLLADVLPKLPPSVHRLIIGVAGELAALPFDALPDPRDQRKPILARYEVAYAPSLTTLAELRDRRLPSPRYDLLGVAPLAGDRLAAALPAYRSAALAPLPWSRREVEEVAQLVRGRSDSLLGVAATEEAFKRLRLRDYKVIHLATHALLDPQNPSRSGIVFRRGSSSDDGWLQMREIYQLDLAGQLVVLSACQTAFGTVSSAEGMQSLARAFTYAGARAVVGTLWKVEDTTAARIVENMYSAIAEGSSVSAALRSAQLEAAGEQPYRTAREWAGWVATGDPASRPDITSPVSTRRWALAFAVIIAAFIAVTAYRFR
ncbi:MAG TPA: CHAT domain-containing tetratricopeptide repeat protein [Thermoanaerobaculia bacterium]